MEHDPGPPPDGDDRSTDSGSLAQALDDLRRSAERDAGDPAAAAAGLVQLSRLMRAAGRLPEAWSAARDVLEARPAPGSPTGDAAAAADEAVDAGVATARASAGGDGPALRQVLRDALVLSVVADLLGVHATDDPVAALAAEGHRLRPDESDEIRRVATQVPDAPEARRRADFAWAVALRLAASPDASPEGLSGRLARVVRCFALGPDEGRLFVLAALAAVHPDAGRLVRLCGRDPLASRAHLADLLRLCLPGEPADAFARVLGTGGVLRRHGLLALAPPSDGSPSPLVAPAAPPADLCEYLLSGDPLAGLSATARVHATPLAPDEACLDPRIRDAIGRAWETALESGERVPLVLSGRTGSGRRTLAASLVGGCSLGLLDLSWPALERTGIARDPHALAARIARACRLAGLVPCLEVAPPPPDPGAAGEGPAPRDALDAPWDLVHRLAGLLQTPLFLLVPPAAAADAARLQGAALFDVPLPDRGTLSALVDRLLDGVDGVTSAARRAVAEAATVPADAAALCDRLRRHASLGADDLPAEALAAVRRRASGEFGSYATRITPGFRPADLVAPDDLKERLAEMVAFHRHRRQVLEDWGFARKLPYGRSLSALFSGPPGTGKTMAATIVASELGLDLFRVDLSQVVSKYVGETEKALSRVFEAASRFHCLVLFDEAEALFGKRGEVKSGTDRYANLEVNFLLQLMEDFDGVTVLTTNFPQNVDEAFKRRLRFRVTFPFPDVSMREALWRAMIPPEAPVEGAVDFAWLAQDFEMAGAHIKNAVVRAAFAAARQGTGITEDGIHAAARLEYEEMGRVVRSRSGYD